MLILDEVSMLSGQMLEKLEQIAREVRYNEKPFGGIQIVLSGDFLQLPPVKSQDNKFAFEARCWTALISKSVELTQVFRQKDGSFVQMLNEVPIICKRSIIK